MIHENGYTLRVQCTVTTLFYAETSRARGPLYLAGKVTSSSLEIEILIYNFSSFDYMFQILDYRDTPKYKIDIEALMFQIKVVMF